MADPNIRPEHVREARDALLREWLAQSQVGTPMYWNIVAEIRRREYVERKWVVTLVWLLTIGATTIYLLL